MAHRMISYRACIGMFVGLAAAWGALAVGWAASNPSDAASTYRSPFDVSYSPDGRLLAVADRSAGAIVFAEADGGRIQRQARLSGKAGAVVWAADSSRAYVAEYDTASVAEVAAADGKTLRRLKVGPYPVGLALAAKRQLLLVANSAMSDVSIVDLSSGQEKARVKVVREPFWIAVTPDESLAVVSNLLPAGAGTDARLTAAVSLIDLGSLQRVADIKLPPNTTGIRQTAVSPDGKWAYAVHTLGRTTLPATQLDRGWVNTNALSIIDLGRRELYATVLLDNLSEGAADPWGVVVSKDGGTMWITIAGTHQLARVELAALHKLLAGEPYKPASGQAMPAGNVWNDIQTAAEKRAGNRMRLVNDLSALHIAEVMTRIGLPGKGPRGLSLSPDGKRLAVGQYFSGNVLVFDTASSKVAAALALGAEGQPDPVRRGEMVFHDATYSFQHWLSCATCHPNEARADGLNWDLPNDGIGNPKSAKSLLQAHLTGPAMWRGVREGMDAASAAGFRFAMFQPAAEDVEAVQAYLRSLQPERSPYRLSNGELSEKAKRGKLVFENDKVGCLYCHNGDQFTGRKSYNVGTQGEFDPKEHAEFDTPTLIEMWRTAPYLHDGRAETLQDVFTKHNPKDQHGATSHLTQEQIEELVEYLLSL